MARLELLLYRQGLGLRVYHPDATRFPPIIPFLSTTTTTTTTTGYTPLSNEEPQHPSLQQPPLACRQSFWVRMKLLMLDRTTTVTLLLFIAIKPLISLANFLYVMVVVLPLTVTGIIFFLPAHVACGPPLSLLEMYGGFVATKLCEREGVIRLEDDDEEEEDRLVYAADETEEEEPLAGSGEVGRLVDIQEDDGEGVEQVKVTVEVNKGGEQE
ncbi:hypothetical protein HDU97_010193 [Phlyctochytrium planicorne]|nr:hypothetical protein HDU97_010193 [Phlyctochytrium planicorne]